MDRKFLEELGLEKETIDKVMLEHGKVVNETKKKADKVESLETQINDYKQQIADRDTQLADLGEKAEGNKALQAEIDRLKSENETAKGEYQAKLDKQAFDFALKDTLTANNVHNPKAVQALLDIESIKLDGEQLLGLTDQLTALKESDPYLFKQDQQQNSSPQIVAGGNPNGGGNATMTKEAIMKEPDNNKRQQLIKENAHLFQ